jgi:hypothetical protein
MIALCTGKYSALQKEKGQNKKEKTRNEKRSVIAKRKQNLQRTTITAI